MAIQMQNFYHVNCTTRRNGKSKITVTVNVTDKRDGSTMTVVNEFALSERAINTVVLDEQPTVVNEEESTDKVEEETTDEVVEEEDDNGN